MRKSLAFLTVSLVELGTYAAFGVSVMAAARVDSFALGVALVVLALVTGFFCLVSLSIALVKAFGAISRRERERRREQANSALMAMFADMDWSYGANQAPRSGGDEQ